MNMKTARLSDQGGKKINDDTVYVEEGKGIYVYVGDGLGGYAGGQQASQAAGRAIMELAAEGGMLEEQNLRQAAAAADAAVRDLQSRTKGNMKTTIVFLAIEDGKARWMHVGDSRLYYFHAGGRMQTMDHSVSQMAVLMGDITPDQIRFHEDRNRVLRALGAENAKPDVSKEQHPVQPGDAFLLCTDGFWEYVYEEEMQAALREAATPDEWLDRMEQLLKARVTGDNDNYTAAAVFC